MICSLLLSSHSITCNYKQLRSKFNKIEIGKKYDLLNQFYSYMHDYEMLFHTSFFLLSLSLFLTITKPIKQIVSPDKIGTELIVIPNYM